MHSLFQVSPVLEADVVGLRSLLQLGHFLGDIGQRVLKVVDDFVDLIEDATRAI